VIELAFTGSRAATGVVFGTGEHATTRLALLLLAAHLREGDRVLDVGTGSGVLALAAARLGAREVEAIDNDPPAARTAAANVRLNALEAVIRVREGSLEAVDAPAFDLAVANILTPVIRTLAPGIRPLLRPNGRLIVTGTLVMEAEEVRAMLIGAGFEIEEERSLEDWQAFTLRRI
jgi:ribosomal protein L11 methyltransferase